MKPLEFLFALLAKFIAFEPGRLTKLKDQASAWEQEQTTKQGWLAKLLKSSETWYIQVGFAILFLFSVKSIGNWLVSSSDADLLDDEGMEDDYMDEQSQKFQLR